MAKIAVIYGSTTGNTAEAAKLIQKALGADLYEIGAVDTLKLSNYSYYVFGTSTWGSGELQDDWYYKREI